MKAALVLLVLVSVAAAAPAPQFGGRQFGGNRQQTSQVTAQATSIGNSNPNTLALQSAQALAASHQVSAFGTSIGINHAQALSQNIAIPVPSGFNNFNNRRYG